MWSDGWKGYFHPCSPKSVRSQGTVEHPLKYSVVIWSLLLLRSGRPHVVNSNQCPAYKKRGSTTGNSCRPTLFLRDGQPGKRLKEPEVPEAQIIPRTTFPTGLDSKKKKKKWLILATSMVLEQPREWNSKYLVTSPQTLYLTELLLQFFLTSWFFKVARTEEGGGGREGKIEIEYQYA